MSASHPNARARNIALLLAIVWTFASAGGGWLLLQQSYTRTVQSQLAGNATHLSEDLAELIPAGTQLSTPQEIDRLDLSKPFDVARRSDPHLLYALVWGPTGRVAGCTDPNRINTVLKPADYQPLAPKEPIRYQARETPPLFPPLPAVLEITVPLVVDSTPIGFVTLGYASAPIADAFWDIQSPLLYAAGGVTLAGLGLILLVLRRTEQAIRRSRDEIEQSARARTSLLTERGMLASVLAHEVRSPLTALRFNLHSLRNYVLTEAGTEKQLDLADRCEREIRRLDLMLNDFLSRTQIIAPVVPTPINRVVNEALDFLRPAFDQKNIRVVTHLDAANPRVAVNPDELRQVLLNLAANAQDAIAAVKHSAGVRAEGSISVSTVLDPEADTVTLLFRDSGVGIPPELHTRIFEPFFTTKDSGSGLGLALVRRVISGAGGTIFCESAVADASSGKPGSTTFRVVLPRAVSEVAAPPPHAEEPDDLVIDHTVADALGDPAPDTPTDRKV